MPHACATALKMSFGSGLVYKIVYKSIEPWRVQYSSPYIKADFSEWRVCHPKLLAAVISYTGPFFTVQITLSNSRLRLSTEHQWFRAQSIDKNNWSGSNFSFFCVPPKTSLYNPQFPFPVDLSRVAKGQGRETHYSQKMSHRGSAFIN
jgi:hypothetical protein